MLDATNESGPDLFRRLGEITRTLHEALRELGYDKQIEATLGHLPDARSRLQYIARVTGEAAEKVLDTVDAAQATQAGLAERAGALETALAANAVPPTADLLAFATAVREGTQSTGAQLTEIMLAQDFHDLTGQTVRKVVDMAGALEESLLKLLIEAAMPVTAEHGMLDGPVADPTRPDVVSDQSQVDDLLESLGF